MSVANGSFSISASETTITFYETLPLKFFQKKR